MNRVVVAAMLTLSFSTGVLDAATYLGLHGVFSANMTGNVIFVSLGVAGQASVPWERALLALGGFALGAAGAGLLGRRGSRRHTSGLSTLVALLVVAVVLGAAAGGLATGGGTRVLDVVTVALGVAMGVQAVAARWIGVGDVTTVVVTSTLAALVGENSMTGRAASGRITTRRALAVITMVLGAVAGAFLVRISVSTAVCASCALTTAVAMVLSRRREQPDGVSGRVSVP